MSRAIFKTQYWGQLVTEQGSEGALKLFGFENISADNQKKESVSFAESGTFWGFARSGGAKFNVADNTWDIKAGQWFCAFSEKGAQLVLAPQSQICLIYHPSHKGLFSMGGPVEKTGRLRYIDNCTDTLLYSPPIKGDPCLNLLHFPPHIDQTVHYHPSMRTGIVISGQGRCVSDEGEVPLTSGTIFYLPKGLRHKFATEDNDMAIISFHPDSDWGPTHEVHPMINRTWMDQR